jgi:hypothetical protein
MDKVHFETSGSLGILALSNPPLNLLSGEVLDDLGAAITEVQRLPLRALLLRAEGKVFSAGADSQRLQGKNRDAVGREIIVPGTVCVDPWTVTDDCGGKSSALPKDKQHVVTICLEYRECGTDFAPMLVRDCNTKEECAAGSIAEGFRVRVLEGAPKPDEGPDICAALFGQTDPGTATTGDYQLINTINLATPRAVDVAHNGKRALVGGGKELFVIDVETCQVTATLSSDAIKPPVSSVTVAPDGGPAFVTHAAGITMVDLERKPSPTIGITVGNDTSFGRAVAAFKGAVIFAIKTENSTVVRITQPGGKIKIIGKGATDLAITPDSKWLYVMTQSKVFRINTSTDKSEETVDSGSSPLTIAARLSRGKAEAFVGGKDNIRRIPAKLASSDKAPSANLRASDFTSDNKLYYAVGKTTDTGKTEAVVFDTNNLKVVGRVRVGDGHHVDSDGVAIAVVPGGRRRRAFIANFGSETVSVIDAVTTPGVPGNSIQIPNPCLAPPACPCVVLGTVVLSDGEIGEINPCPRTVLYSNAMLFEMILCLIARINECCGQNGPNG